MVLGLIVYKIVWKDFKRYKWIWFCNIFDTINAKNGYCYEKPITRKCLYLVMLFHH